MPVYKVQSPDGAVHKFEGPAGASPDEILSVAQSHFGSAKKQALPVSQTRTAFDQGMQGATFGFADEAMDRIGAGIASIATGEKYNDLLKEARGQSKERLEQEWQQHPATSFASNLAGGALTGKALTSPTAITGVIPTTGARGALNAIPEAGAALANYVGSGSLPARMLKGGATGMASGALYGAGSAEDGKRAEGAGQGAILGGVLGAAAPAVVDAVKSQPVQQFLKSETYKPKPPIINADTVKDMANKAYKAAADSGAVLPETFTNKFLSEASNLTPQTEAGKLIAGDSKTSKIFEKLQSLKDRALSLNEAQEIDEFLGDTIDGMMDAGRMTKEARKVFELQSTFRKMIDDVPDQQGFEALKEGRKLWSAQAKMRDVEKIITRAEMTDNPASSVKSGFRTLYNSSRIKGYSPEERALIKKAAESGVVVDALRTFGSRLIPIGSAVAGGGLPGTVAAQAASMASRGAANKIQINRAQAVAQQIAKSATSKPTPPQIPTGSSSPLLSALAAPAVIGKYRTKITITPQEKLLKAMQGGDD